jgi:Fe-S oxidoreductase
MRCGNEYLFQTLAQANIDVMNGYGVKKIIAICPHGYNALKKDYRTSAAILKCITTRRSSRN